jgi:hypothetical protein
VLQSDLIQNEKKKRISQKTWSPHQVHSDSHKRYRDISEK